MVALPNIGGALFSTPQILLTPAARYDLFCVKIAVKPQPTNHHAVTLPKYESARLERKAKIRNGARTPKNVYVVYQPRRRPITVQSLVVFR